MMAVEKLAVQVALVALVVQVASTSFADSVRTRVATSVSGVRSELLREGLYPQSVEAAPAPAKTRESPGSAKKAASSYAFETVNAGVPARWNTCLAIPVVVYSRGAPAGMMNDLRTALAEVNTATGLRFTITGTANRPLTAHNSNLPGVPVVIGFANSLSGVFADTSMAGLTSTAVAPGTNTISGATVAFNTDLLGTYTSGSTGADPRVALVLHELGHVVGLDHVASRAEIMFASSGGARVFGAGDLAGLHALATPGCAPTKKAATR